MPAGGSGMGWRQSSGVQPAMGGAPLASAISYGRPGLERPGLGPTPGVLASVLSAYRDTGQPGVQGPYPTNPLASSLYSGPNSGCAREPRRAITHFIHSFVY